MKRMNSGTVMLDGPWSTLIIRILPGLKGGIRPASSGSLLACTGSNNEYIRPTVASCVCRLAAICNASSLGRGSNRRSEERKLRMRSYLHTVNNSSYHRVSNSHRHLVLCIVIPQLPKKILKSSPMSKRQSMLTTRHWTPQPTPGPQVVPPAIFKSVRQ
jgi:hypothetical protein